MKKIFKYGIAVLVLINTMIAFNSCEYKEIADADYFDEVIYMPAAIHNPYMINTVPEKRGDTPTPGYPVRYKTDATNNQFNVLLGVYRSGVYSKGSFNVDVIVRTDTIQRLIDASGLPAGTEILPSDKYSIVSSVNMKDGEDLAKFDLVVDMNFLREGNPDKIYALAVEISSDARETNPDFATTLIVIETKIMKPTASFTSAVGAEGKVTFTNTSLYGMDYSWNFGDGSAISMEKSPVHTFASSGTYPVTLTVNGITGTMDAAVFTQDVVIP